jgi:predicted metalloendopeptidase
MKPQPRALLRRLAAAASAGPGLHAVGDGSTPGYSPAKTDKGGSLRKDFYRNAAGHLLQRAEIPAGEPEINAFTEL